MSYVPGKTYLKAEQWGRGWIVFWACFGHRRPRVLYGEDKRAKQFPSREDAMNAGLALIQKHEPDITSSTPIPSADEVAERLAAEVIQFKDRRERECRELRQVFRGTGKGFLPVEVVKRRGA